MSQSTANVFINCATTETRCYRDYLFQTLSNCNFVWDANNADVQILVSEKQNSQGGFRINFEFTGMKTLFGKKDTLWFDLPQGQTEEFIRTNIVQQISKGLNYLFHHTIFAQSFDIKPLAILKTEPKPNQAQQHDPWNLWNFTASVEGYIEGQSNYLFYNIEPKFTARKITPKHKWVLNIQQGFKQNSYTINEEKQSILVKSLDIIPLYAGSINEHWSWGAMIHYRTNEYVNLKSSVRIAPIIEYNIFPYSKNLVKQMRLAYQIGLQKQRYLGETIYEKLEETLPYQRLALLTDITRNWGSIRGTVQSSSFLNDLQKNRLSFSSEFSFRLAKGLFFNVNGQFEIINDQISLLKKPLADDVYLLGGQQLATKNNFWGEFGLTYTFGSKYNSIVNPRMGYLDEVWFQNK
ncbi:hypothetical protein [Arcicella aurantiaca]|nr:hypothetical protein [Arcicella aurantiaca]